MLDWRSKTRSRFQPPKRSRTPTPSRRVTPMAIAALAGFTVIAALVLWILMRPAPTVPMLPARFAIAQRGLPLNVSGLARDLALSPDGRRLVYRAGGSNTAGSPLMVRAIDRLDAQPVADVSNALAPFFSLIAGGSGSSRTRT